MPYSPYANKPLILGVIDISWVTATTFINSGDLIFDIFIPGFAYNIKLACV